MQPIFIRSILLACLAASIASCANDPGAETGYSVRYGELDRTVLPAPDPNRKVSQQDCSKPFFPDGGNLLCR